MPGTVLGRQYQIIERIGAGGMGEVLLASDLALDRFVAIKILRPELSTLLETDARFRREARLLARLCHPNVVTVHAFGSASELHYIVMEYVRGESLEERLRRSGRLEPRLVGHVMAQIGSAVAEAHKSGIVHRDLKPANVLVTSLAGDPHFIKVVDFGVAKVFGREGGLELAVDGQASGTPLYMSPEQIDARDADGRSDVYALGIMACELITGARPFDETGGVARLFAERLFYEPTAPSRLAPELCLTPGIDAVIGRALARDPGDRYQSVEHFTHDLLRELRALGDGVASASRPSAAVHSAVLELSETVIVDMEGAGQTASGTTAQTMTGALPWLGGSGAWTRREGHDERTVRSATVLYVDLSSGGLDGSLDVDEYLDCLAVVGARFEKLLERHGGVALGPFAERVLALFEPEGAAENDAERAVDAALQIRSALSALASDPTIPPSFRLSFRVGVDAGRVAITQPRGGAPMLSGAPIYEARRIALASAPGEVHVAHAVLRRVRGLYETEPVGDEGGRRRVLSKKSTTYLGTNEIHGVRVGLIGRDEEMSVLRAALARAVRERATEVLVIAGPAGVGKSRLCAGFMEELEDRPGERYRFEMGRSTPAGQGTPYEPFIGAIRHRARLSDDDSPDQVRVKLDHYVRRFLAEDPTSLGEEEQVLGQRLAALLGVPDAGTRDEDVVAGEEARKKLMFDAVALAYRRLAREHPLLFLFEDFEWATAATKALIGHVLERLAGMPALFVLVCRTDGGAMPDLSFVHQRSDVTLLPLSPLTEASSEALIRHVLRALIEVPGWLVRQIGALSGGVPLIVEETVHELLDESVIVVEEGRWRLSSSRGASVRLPETLEQLFLGRIDRLEPLLREAVEAAAVAGRRFWPSLLAELMEGRFEPRLLSELLRRGIFVERRDASLQGELNYAFAQTALQEVAYRNAPRARRRALHRAAALWLERATRGSGGTHDEAIGHHFREAGELARALPYTRSAAERAMRTHAIEEAVRLLEGAREILLEMPASEIAEDERQRQLAPLLASLVHELVLAGSLARAVELADEALGRFGRGVGIEAHELARIAIGKGWALEHLGRYAEARESFVEAERLLDEEGSLLALMALTGEMGARGHLGDYGDCAERLRRTLALCDGTPASQEWGRALSSAHRVLANSEVLFGRFEESERQYRRAHELALAANAPVEAVDALNGLAALHYFGGRLDRAEDTWRQALAQAERWDLVQHRSVLLSNVGELELARGDARAARETLGRAEALHVRLGSERGLGETQRALAECHLVLGALDEARSHAERGLALAEKLRSPYMRGTAHRTLARVMHAQCGGADEEARAAVARHLDAGIAAFEAAGMDKLAAETRELFTTLLGAATPS
ncbi:protein kinase domain-containing protein [Polyangium aurulentum]|uniref:protein kinase domain-containing protein n=1 Tax=Polyangium aurulentum TaxID=2567896 RepID=UPI0010AE5E67|nr:protein kinase [Polyangium aurulentum]UQA55231.1 protein kinase [Polyangium aurulentum]